MTNPERKYLNFIAGDWRPAKSGKTYQTCNPADTREVLAEYPAGEKADAQAAIEAAQRAFPSWAAMTPAP